MTVHVKAGKVRLHLWFPLSTLKSRFGYKVVKRAIENSAQKHSEKTSQTSESAELAANETQKEQMDCAKAPSITREQVVEMYNIIKRCVKANGHFNLVEVNSHDGERVRIRV